MNTPAHILIGAAVFSRPQQRSVTAAAIFGAVLPDLSLYVLAGVSLFLLRIPPERVFNELYFSDAWQTVFAVDNSVLVWGALLAIALKLRHPASVALCGAALLHIALDLPLHHDDGRPHFWPLSTWVFESPVSYWDSAHHAGWVAPVEAAIAMIAGGVLWQRFGDWRMRAFVVCLLLAELWVVRNWLLFF